MSNLTLGYVTYRLLLSTDHKLACQSIALCIAIHIIIAICGEIGVHKEDIHVYIILLYPDDDDQR